MRIRDVKNIIGAYLDRPVHNIFYFTSSNDGYDFYYVKDNKISAIVKFDPYLGSVVEVYK